MKESINKAEEAYHKFKHTLEEESDSDSIDEVTIRGRCTRIKTCCETPENIFYTNNLFLAMTVILKILLCLIVMMIFLYLVIVIISI